MNLNYHLSQWLEDHREIVIMAVSFLFVLAVCGLAIIFIKAVG